MNTITGVKAMAVAALAAVAVLQGGAQAPPFKRNILQRGDLSMPGREGVLALAELSAGGEIGRHTHPGEEISYVLEGTMVLEVEGRSPRQLKAGDAFLVEAGTAHSAKNTGASTVKVIATYIVEKGKPLATPAR